MLTQSETLITAETIAASFTGRNTPKRKARVQKVLETLVVTGAAASTADEKGKSIYFVQ